MGLGKGGLEVGMRGTERRVDHWGIGVCSDLTVDVCIQHDGGAC